MLGLALVVGLSLGLVSGKAVQAEADIADMVVEKDDAEGDEEVATKAPYVPGGDKTPFLRGGSGKAPYVPGGDKTPFLRGGPGGQGGHFNPHKPDFVPDPSVTNPGGQGYNPGNNGGQGYNPGNNGGQGYNPGNNGGQGYNPGNNGGQGYNPGNNGGQGYNPGNNGGQGYNPGNDGGSGYNPGNNGGQGYNPGNNGGQGYNPGNNGGQGYNPGNNGGQGYNPGNNGGSGYNPGNNGGQGYNPGNNGGQGYNPGNNGGQGYNPGGYNPGGRNGDEIHFPGAFNGIGGRSQFRTPIVFADDEDASEEGSKPTFQAVGALGGPQLSMKAQGAPQGVQTLPGFPLRRFPVRRPYVPGQDKKPLLRGQQEVFVQEPGAPGGPWDGSTVALLFQPKDFNPSIQTGSVQTLPSPIQFADTPQFRKLRPSQVEAQFNPQIQSGLAQTLPSTIQFAGAQFNPQIQAGLAQTLPSPIQFAEEEPQVLLLQPLRSQIQGRTPAGAQGVQTLPSPIQFASTRQQYVPGGDKTPFLRPTSFNPQIEAGLAQTLPSGIQFAGDAQPYVSGTDKGPYLRPQQQPKVIVVPGKSEPSEGIVDQSKLGGQASTYPYPGITFPYFQRSATPPFRASPAIIYIF